jgi:hypothetical protein
MMVNLLSLSFDVGELECVSTEMDKIIHRLWPVTLGVGILMAVCVLAILALSFCLVYGAAFSILCENETWQTLKQSFEQ